MGTLVYNSSADSQDVISEINSICNSDNFSYPLKDKARRINLALDRFFTLAFQAGGQWPYDDPNRDTVPVETINIVSGTQSYNIDDFTSEVLGILRVEMIDSNNAD